MGMAASQARYLALVARKSNCEYEGQQINQARLNLSNQSANLFNQMLGLNVPIPPSTQDFTKTQYSFSDGVNAAVIDDWKQLATKDKNYNYVVTYHYNADVYTGSQKKMNDPQVLFTQPSQTIDPTTYKKQSENIQAQLTKIKELEEAYETAKTNYNTYASTASQISTYRDSNIYTGIYQYSIDAAGRYNVRYNPKMETIGGVPYYIYSGSDNKTYYSSDKLNYNTYDPSTKISPFTGLDTDKSDYYVFTDANGVKYYSTDSKLDDESVIYTYDTYLTNNNKAYSVYKDTAHNNQKYYTEDGTTYYTYNGTNLTPAAIPDDAALSADKTFNKSNVDYSTLTATNVLNPADVSGITLTQDDEGDIFAPHTYSEANAIAGNEPDKSIKTLIDSGAITADEANNFYISANDETRLAMKSELDALAGGPGSGTSSILPIYHTAGTAPEGQSWTSIESVDAKLTELSTILSKASSDLLAAQMTYANMNVPKSVGNCELTPISELTSSQEAEIKQVIADMKKDGVSTHLTDYYDPDTGEYKGGIYQFTLQGKTYYSTYDDLADSSISGTGINHIDGQDKLAYYRADYVSTKIEKTENAMIETDSQGRFTSIRIGDDTVKYTLNTETITDDAAYQDAMNKFYYENAVYDKMVQDINAKTSIIQQEDRTLELRLKQLETERTALDTEIEAVQKVVKDNVEKSFKTFS